MSATISLIVDGVEKGYTDSHNCVRRYLVKGEPDPHQKPTRGAPYSYMADWPGTSYRVQDYHYTAILYDTDTPANRIYELSVTGSTAVGTIGWGTATDTLKRNTVQRTMRQEPFSINADMASAHRATRQDLGYWPVPGKSVLQVYQGPATLTPELWKVPMPSYIDHSYAEEGDVVFNNSQSQWYSYWNDTDNDTDNVFTFATRTSTAGSAQAFDGMPFQNTSAANPLLLSDIGQTWKCRVHRVTYWVESNREYTLNAPYAMNDGLVFDWGPLSGRRYGPMTVAVPSTLGLWRCLSQDIDQDRDEDGQELIMVTREFIRVPAKLGSGVRWAKRTFGTWTADWP